MAEAPWLTLARLDIGTLEKPGKGSNPAVLAYFKDAGHPEVVDDAVAWCSAFVGAILKRSGLEGTGSLSARSYEDWGVKLKAPSLGSIGVKRRAGPSPAWQGHVGFVVAANTSWVWLLGGNQSDAVSIAAFPRWQFTEFRWPSAVTFTLEKLPDSFKGAQAVKEA